MDDAMNNKVNYESEILFGYMNTPSYGCFGEDDGGFSIDIYPDGKLIYKTYIFDMIEKTKRELKLDFESIENIVTVLSTYEKDIATFDEHIDNGSCDGNGNFFIFNGKRIITWNIEYFDEDEIKKLNPKYYEEYLPMIKQQNLMIEIFARVSEILKKQGINLRIYEVNFNEND